MCELRRIEGISLSYYEFSLVYKPRGFLEKVIGIACTVNLYHLCSSLNSDFYLYHWYSGLCY